MLSSTVIKLMLLCAGGFSFIKVGMVALVRLCAGFCSALFLGCLLFLGTRFEFLVFPCIPMSHQFGGSSNEYFMSSYLFQEKIKDGFGVLVFSEVNFTHLPEGSG